MKEEIRIFLTAVKFYTRIPCPSWVDHSERYLAKSRKYLPIIGWIVGGVSASVLYGLNSVLPMNVAILLAITAGVLLTGAFHEDGFTDVCDAFGGGFTRGQILNILKDSRIGAYGAVGVMLLFGLKFAVLSEIAHIGPGTVCLVLLASHSVSRCAALTIIFTHQYVRDDDTSKSSAVVMGRSSLSEILLAIAAGVAPLLLFGTWWVFTLLVPVYVARTYLASYFKKWIGGYTGDCLGATQQICEVVFSMSFIGLWKYI